MPGSEDMAQLMDGVDLKVIREGVQRLQDGDYTLEVWMICLRKKGDENPAVPFTTTMLKHNLDDGWELMLRRTRLEAPQE